MRVPLTSRVPTLFAWVAGRGVVCLVVSVCACVFVCTRGVHADSQGDDVPVVGGTAALSRALGLDPAPERARFVTELVHVLYDAAEGKRGSSEALRARAWAHLDAVERFRAALAGAQRSGEGLTLSGASQGNEREELERVLDVIGLQLTEKDHTRSVVQIDSQEAADRLQLLRTLGFDADDVVTRLNSGASVRIDLPTDTVPLPLSSQTWTTAVFQRPIGSDSLFSAVIQDRSAALLCHGLAALDDETLDYLAEHPAVLSRMYQQNAAVFAAFGGSLHIRQSAVVVPGGASATPLWEGVLGESAASPDRFVRELFSRREGRVAYLYDAVTQLDPGQRAFALGLWIADPARRLSRFKSFLDAMQAFPGWGVPERPFSRPPDDAVLMLTRMNADQRGVPVAPSWRTFWSQAFNGADIPANPARRLRKLQKGGIIDSAWMAEAVLKAPTELRAERLDQLAFGQRAFAGIPDDALPDALVAMRAFPRYRMLVLTLERLGIRSAAVYAASVRHAGQLAALDSSRAFAGLNQYQGALALLARLARVHTLDTTEAEALVASLSSVPLTARGYAGGIARWLRTELMPLLAAGEANVDAAMLRSVSGPARTGDARPVAWEERDYRLDVIEPEIRRVTRILQKLKTEPLRDALRIDAVASTLMRSDLEVNEIEAATGELRTVLSGLSPAIGDNVSRAIRDLSKITRPSDQDQARDVARFLMSVVDEMLASALRAWAYAVDLGDASGGRIISGDVSVRHDLGLAEHDVERRARQPWAEPHQVVQPSVPWHMAGSLLGLDLGLSQTMLRRVSSDALPQPPRLLLADREVFARTAALLIPTDVPERDVDTILDAIGAGGRRVAQLGVKADTLDEVAAEIAMDGWRRRALRWTLMHEPANASSYFSLAELVHLGRPSSSASLSGLGVAAAGLDGCLCMAFPTPGRWTVMVGRSRGGQISGQVADLNLRVLMALKDLSLPPALAKGVLAAATQDYIDSVGPLYPDDWLTLVRSAQAIPTDRIADYVAALTADGTLSPVASSSQAR